jgi:hypothetical protein
MKTDLKKTVKSYFTATPDCTSVDFGKLSFITMVGEGEPRGEVFMQAVQALYKAAYAVKNYCKKIGDDFMVSPLEGLWWVNSSTFFMDTPRSKWKWKLMIMMPDFVTPTIFKEVMRELIDRKKELNLTELQFEKINEGHCIQVMHTGPYAEESKTIKMIDDYLKKNQLLRNGHHHEIYLSDPNKVAPSKMKTILRQPVK